MIVSFCCRMHRMHIGSKNKTISLAGNTCLKSMLNIQIIKPESNSPLKTLVELEMKNIPVFVF